MMQPQQQNQSSTDADRLPARYRVIHRTNYQYSTPVAGCQNQLRMTPQTRPGIQVHQSEIRVVPIPDSVEQYVDCFGNDVTIFAIEALHDELIVESESEVTITPAKIEDADCDVRWRVMAERIVTPVKSGLMEIGEFAFASPRITWDDEVRDYAMQSFNASESLVEASIDLTKRIQADFKYDTTATHVDTTVRESFDLRAGVCQDFAQVQIACFRSVGLASRYVSGYLRTVPPLGQPKLIGADESHAWCSVYTGCGAGWLDLDPTNGCITNRDHLPFCIGRDYLDVSPMRGVAIGSGAATLKVSVDVREIETPA